MTSAHLIGCDARMRTTGRNLILNAPIDFLFRHLHHQILQVELRIMQKDILERAAHGSKNDGAIHHIVLLDELNQPAKCRHIIVVDAIRPFEFDDRKHIQLLANSEKLADRTNFPCIRQAIPLLDIQLFLQLLER